MKILNLGGHFAVPFLRAAGHTVLALTPGHFSSEPEDIPCDFFLDPGSYRAKIQEMVAEFKPDWILQVDDSSPLIHLGLEDLPCPKAWYAVDTHLHGEWQVHLAPLFDLVFCAQKNQVEKLSQYQPRVEWLPLFFLGTPAFLPWAQRRHDVSFVGTLDPLLHGRRIAFLDSLRERGIKVNIQQGDVHQVYRDSRIVINQSSANDLNFRFFEAMGNGALLVTDRLTHSHAELGQSGRDFLVYEPDNARELADKIRFALGDPLAAEAIARRGHAMVVGSHTGSRRIHTMLNALSRLEGDAGFRPKSGNSIGSVERIELNSHLAWVNDHISRLSIPEPLSRFFAAEAFRLASEIERLAPGNVWSAIIQLRQAMDQDSLSEAIRHLDRIEKTPDDQVLRRHYFFFRSLLLAHSGKRTQALQSLLLGLKEFPEDVGMLQLRTYLASGPAES